MYSVENTSGRLVTRVLPLVCGSYDISLLSKNSRPGSQLHVSRYGKCVLSLALLLLVWGFIILTPSPPPPRNAAGTVQTHQARPLLYCFWFVIFGTRCFVVIVI